MSDCMLIVLGDCITAGHAASEACTAHKGQQAEPPEIREDTTGGSTHQFIGMLTPAARPAEQAAAREAIAPAAICVATSDEEQAVSMLSDGPCR